MSSEPGRNSPCPCGSGKKYKRCCQGKVRGFTVPARPLEGEPRNTHGIMGPDGQWIEAPGSLWVQIHTEDVDVPDATIVHAFDRYRQALSQQPELLERLRDCQHKCRAADYHRRAIATEIESEIERYSREHRAQSGATFVNRNEVLLYETEAFLFQAKSAVDSLIRALAPVVEVLRPFDMFRGKGEIAGGAVLAVLREPEPRLHSILESARQQWIQELKELRDTITHVSELEGFTYFVENQYHGGPFATIDLPKMPSGKRLDVYCADVVDQLLELTGLIMEELAGRAGAH